MSRILFWVALFCLIVAAIRSKIRSAAVKADQAAREANGGNRGGNVQVGQTEPMARCNHCHMYFPESEAVRADGQDYCSPAHVRLPPV